MGYLVFAYKPQRGLTPEEQDKLINTFVFDTKNPQKQNEIFAELIEKREALEPFIDKMNSYGFIWKWEPQFNFEYAIIDFEFSYENDTVDMYEALVREAEAANVEVYSSDEEELIVTSYPELKKPTQVSKAGRIVEKLDIRPDVGNMQIHLGTYLIGAPLFIFISLWLIATESDNIQRLFALVTFVFGIYCAAGMIVLLPRFIIWRWLQYRHKHCGIWTDEKGIHVLQPFANRFIPWNEFDPHGNTFNGIRIYYGIDYGKGARGWRIVNALQEYQRSLSSEAN